jgi:hypothetical protein
MSYTSQEIMENLFSIESDSNPTAGDMENRRRVKNKILQLFRTDRVKFIDPTTHKIYCTKQIEMISSQNKRTKSKYLCDFVEGFCGKDTILYCDIQFIMLAGRYLSFSVIEAVHTHFPLVFDVIKQKSSLFHMFSFLFSEKSCFELEDWHIWWEFCGSQPVTFDVYHNIRDNLQFDRDARRVLTDKLLKTCVEVSMDELLEQDED